MAPGAIRRAMPEIVRCAQALYVRRCPDLQRKVCPGVRALLRRLERRGIVIGLVTGNLSRIAWKKMEHAGLRPFFRYGAFAESARDRAGLVRLAIRDARAQRWINPASTITLIGDHPNDVSAARANRVRSIAVATGLTPLEELVHSIRRTSRCAICDRSSWRCCCEKSACLRARLGGSTVVLRQASRSRVPQLRFSRPTRARAGALRRRESAAGRGDPQSSAVHRADVAVSRDRLERGPHQLHARQRVWRPRLRARYFGRLVASWNCPAGAVGLGPRAHPHRRRRGQSPVRGWLPSFRTRVPDAQPIPEHGDASFRR